MDETDTQLDHLIASVCTYEGKLHEQAYAFLHTVANWARVTDDAHDQDKDYTPEIAAVAGLTADAFTHPYALRYPEVRGVLIAALNAWDDSNKWMNQPGLKHPHALVIRDYINELLPVVAYLIGGYAHMRAHSLAIRTAFLKPQDWELPEPH